MSYRNAEGKPRNRRVLIGKIDATTGQPVYKPEYVARMVSAGVTVEGAASLATFTADEIRRSTGLEFGTMYLLQHKRSRSASKKRCNARCPTYLPRS